MAETGTVYIVDDDPWVRESMRLLVRSVGLDARAFAGASEFLASLGPEPRGCLVLDVRMPGTSGLDLLEALRGRGIEMPVVVVTGHADVPMAVRALKGGAMDFLQKPVNDQVLLDTIIRALESDAARRAACGQSAEAAQRLARLTPREQQVLGGLLAGKSNKVIALELGISDRTVETHRAHIMEKLAVRSLPELICTVLAAQS